MLDDDTDEKVPEQQAETVADTEVSDKAPYADDPGQQDVSPTADGSERQFLSEDDLEETVASQAQTQNPNLSTTHEESEKERSSQESETPKSPVNQPTQAYLEFLEKEAKTFDDAMKAHNEAIARTPEHQRFKMVGEPTRERDGSVKITWLRPGGDIKNPDDHVIHTPGKEPEWTAGKNVKDVILPPKPSAGIPNFQVHRIVDGKTINLIKHDAVGISTAKVDPDYSKAKTYDEAMAIHKDAIARTPAEERHKMLGSRILKDGNTQVTWLRPGGDPKNPEDHSYTTIDKNGATIECKLSKHVKSATIPPIKTKTSPGFAVYKWDNGKKEIISRDKRNGPERTNIARNLNKDWVVVHTTESVARDTQARREAQTQGIIDQYMQEMEAKDKSPETKKTPTKEVKATQLEATEHDVGKAETVATTASAVGAKENQTRKRANTAPTKIPDTMKKEWLDKNLVQGNRKKSSEPGPEGPSTTPREGWKGKDRGRGS